MGQQSGQGGFIHVAFAPGDQHAQLGRKFVKGLAANAAGIGGRAVGGDGDGRKLPHAFAYGLKQGGALGTGAGAKGSVFYVAAREYAAVR